MLDLRPVERACAIGCTSSHGVTVFGVLTPIAASLGRYAAHMARHTLSIGQALKILYEKDVHFGAKGIEAGVFVKHPVVMLAGNVAELLGLLGQPVGVLGLLGVM